MFIFNHGGQVKSCAINPLTLNSFQDAIDIVETDAPLDKSFREAWVNNAGILSLDPIILNKKKVIDEALIRINLVFPTIQSLDDLNFFSELWKSIAPAARTATVEFQSAIDVYTVAKEAIANETIYENVVWP